MSDSARIADVVAGHRRVVLISGGDPNRLDQHTAVIKAATKAQVEHVYYTSGLRADDVRFEIGADHKPPRTRCLPPASPTRFFGTGATSRTTSRPWPDP